MIFLYGFLVGVVTNQVFVMLTRLLPATWVRYQVKMGKLTKDEPPGMWAWMLSVRIEPPRWRRALMEPLTEYLEVSLALDNDIEKVEQGKWIAGDVSNFMIRADGAMTNFIVVFSGTSSTGYLGDDRRIPLEDGKHIVNVRVVRSFDESVAAEMEFPFTVDKGKPTVPESLVIKFPRLIKWRDMPSRHTALATAEMPTP